MNYGAKGALWAKMESDTDKGLLPKYGTSKEFGGINETNETLNFAEASAYADNRREIDISEFSDGSLDTKALYRPLNVSAEMFGAANDGDNAMSNGEDDVAPFGGYGFYTTKMDKNKTRYHEVVFYPKVQAKVQGENAKTKENKITLEYEGLQFTVYSPLCGKYRVKKRFTDEDEAIAYLAGLFAGTVPVAGLPETGWVDPAGTIGKLEVKSADGTAEGTTKITVTPTKAEDGVYKYKIGEKAEEVKNGEDVTAWEDWDGSADITAETGKTITVVEANKYKLAVKVGSATVQSKAGE